MKESGGDLGYLQEDFSVKPQKQTILGEEGNCFATCVAMLLDMDVQDVPNFCHGDEEDWHSRFRHWLRARGYMCFLTSGPMENVDSAYIASGPGPRGRRHSVVIQPTEEGDIIYDPHPSDEGLIEVQEYEYILRFMGLRGSFTRPWQNQWHEWMEAAVDAFKDEEVQVAFDILNCCIGLTGSAIDMFEEGAENAFEWSHACRNAIRREWIDEIRTRREEPND